MKYKRLLLTSAAVLMCTSTAFAHHGNGHQNYGYQNYGHHNYEYQNDQDNCQYYCNGYPAHLHLNGVCPYAADSSNSDSSYTPNNTVPGSNRNNCLFYEQCYGNNYMTNPHCQGFMGRC